MAEYTRTDEIFFTNDLRLDNAIGKQVFGADSPTDLLFLANHGNPDLWCETLAFINKDADFRPFVTYVEGFGYRHYDAIIIKKDDQV